MDSPTPHGIECAGLKAGHTHYHHREDIAKNTFAMRSVAENSQAALVKPKLDYPPAIRARSTSALRYMDSGICPNVEACSCGPSP